MWVMLLGSSSWWRVNPAQGLHFLFISIWTNKRVTWQCTQGEGERRGVRDRNERERETTMWPWQSCSVQTDPEVKNEVWLTKHVYLHNHVTCGCITTLLHNDLFLHYCSMHDSVLIDLHNSADSMCKERSHQHLFLMNYLQEFDRDVNDMRSNDGIRFDVNALPHFNSSLKCNAFVKLHSSETASSTRERESVLLTLNMMNMRV